jgi:hypothetical protein
LRGWFGGFLALMGRSRHEFLRKPARAELPLRGQELSQKTASQPQWRAKGSVGGRTADGPVANVEPFQTLRCGKLAFIIPLEKAS